MKGENKRIVAEVEWLTPTLCVAWLYVEDERGEVISPYDVPADWPEEFDEEFLRSKGVRIKHVDIGKMQ